MAIKTRTSGIMVNINVTPAAAGFTGPGDVVSGASAFYGLKAYNAAYATGSNPCLDLHDDTTGTFVATINILATGSMDAATAATTIAGGASRVGKVYDHTGNARHVVQATNTNRPQLQLTGLNGGPALFFDNSRGDRLTTAGTITLAQPNSYVAVMGAITGAFGQSPIFGDIDTIDIWFGMRGNSALFSMDAGSEFGFIAIPNANIHSLFGLASGASSFMQLDASPSSTSNLLTGGYTGHLGFGVNNVGGSWNGYICQAGLWGSDISTNFGALNTNQHTNWGF